MRQIRVRGRFAAGARPVTNGRTVAMDPAAVEAYLAGLQDKLQSVGDDAQLANVDLQDAVQKQQQMLQLLSQLAKQLHDTEEAIIHNMDGGDGDDGDDG